jgi:auxin efflux carrier family
LINEILRFCIAGLFIGLQDKIIMTGPGLTTLGMVLRFVAAPASTMVGAILLGLRGDVLRVAIIQVLILAAT